MFRNMLKIQVVIFALLGSAPMLADQELPSTNSSVTFLYYSDLAAAEDFYANILGFEKDFDGEWVKIFRIADGGRVGLVDEKKGFLQTADSKPVMLSVDTSDIQGWWQRLQVRAEKYILKPLKTEADGFVTGFLLKDPEGYHVEFFQWKEK